MPDTLHLAAWNVNHRTGRKSIPPDTLHAIAALDIDVLVLTELTLVGYRGFCLVYESPRGIKFGVGLCETA
jgi:hypothetical protein